MKIKTIFWMISVLFAAACASTSEIEPKKDPKEKVVGNGTYEAGEVLLTGSPAPQYYYGRLRVEPELFLDQFNKAKPKDVVGFLKNIFSQETQEFGVTIVPKLRGIELPKQIVFWFYYDSPSKTWKSKFNSVYESPVVRLDTGTKFEYELQYVTATQKGINVNNLMKIFQTAAGFGGAPSWVVGAASQERIQSLVVSSNELISATLSPNKSSEIRGELDPMGTKSYQRIYKIRLPNNTLLAQIKMSVPMISSVVASSGIITEFGATTLKPKATSYLNPLTTLRKSDSESQTYESLLKTDNLTDGLSTMESVYEFDKACDKIKQKLIYFGLNQYDMLISMRALLMGAKYANNYSLWNGSCLSATEKTLLTEMEIPLNFVGSNPSSDLNPKNIDLLTKYLVGSITPEETTAIVNLFLPQVVLNCSNFSFLDYPKNCSNPVERQEFLGRLKSAGIARVVASPIYPNDPKRKIYFRQLISKDIGMLELVKGAGGAGVIIVNAKLAPSEELSPSVREYLQKPAEESVKNSEIDINRVPAPSPDAAPIQ